MDETACNYDSETATEGDGSCEYISPIDLGEDIVTCEETVILDDLGEGYDSYLWSTGETSQIIEVNESGNYSVNVNSNQNINNYSMNFDGVDDCVIVNSDVISLLPITISADIFINEIDINNTIISKDNSWLWYIRNADNSMQLSLYNQILNQQILHEFNFSSNEWYNVAISIDENNNVSQYVNGENLPLFETVWNTGIDGINLENGMKILELGCGKLMMKLTLNGSLDNVQIWNRILTQEELIDNMNCYPTGSNEEGLVGYWNFEEGPDQAQVTDLSSGGNNGIINGASYSDNVNEQNCSISCDGNEIDGFTYGGYFNGSNYYISSNYYSWTESNELCNITGGHLVTISSVEEQNYIQSILPGEQSNSYWIGLFKM